MIESQNDFFELYNLKVEVIGEEATFVCSHRPGYAFDVIGENISFSNSPNSSFSFYTLAGLTPLFAAKQRKTHPNDWMTTDEVIACPDKNCGAKFLITRNGATRFSHSEVTKEPLRESSK